MSLFGDAHLLDVALVVLSPTWSNGRCGNAVIAKYLDRFFMADSFCNQLGRFCSWNYSFGFSDHKAIVLQLDFDQGFIFYPFKFNPTWLIEDDCNKLVVEQWVVYLLKSLFT